MNYETCDVVKYGNEPKYERLEPDGYGISRIRALRDIGETVKAGDVGGFIGKDAKLSQTGNSWIYDDATLTGNAKLAQDAELHDNVLVDDNAKVVGYAKLFEWARVCNYATVGDYATLRNFACVKGQACVTGEAVISGNARISGSVLIGARAQVFGAARITDKARIFGDVGISGDAFICGNARVYGDTVVVQKGMISANMHIHDDVVISRALVGLLQDPRGYTLVQLPNGAYQAGCQTFDNYQDAICHWGDEDYPNPELGERYVLAILTNEARVSGNAHSAISSLRNILTPKAEVTA